MLQTQLTPLHRQHRQHPLFRARLVNCETAAAPTQELRGTAHLLGDSSSFAQALLRRALIAVQREWGR